MYACVRFGFCNVVGGAWPMERKRAIGVIIRGDLVKLRGRENFAEFRFEVQCSGAMKRRELLAKRRLGGRVRW